MLNLQALDYSSKQIPRKGIQIKSTNRR